MYAIMNEIAANGPVTCGFNVTAAFQDFFGNPANATKVYDPSAVAAYVQKNQSDTKGGGHASVIVGYGLANNSNKDNYT